MSLLKKIVRKAGKVVGRAAGLIPGPVGAVARVATAATAARSAARVATRSALPALPGIGRVATAGGAVGGMVGVARRTVGKIGTVGGAVATGAVLYDQFGNAVTKRRRSINPLNHRALKRAIRRIEKSKSIMKRLGAITIKKEKC